MENKIYTMEDWRRDKTFSAEVGQVVEDSIYYEMLGCLPPAYWKGGVMQVGEPYTHDKELGKPLYTTFAQNGNGQWVFKGHCLLGTTEHRKGWGDN